MGRGEVAGEVWEEKACSWDILYKRRIHEKKNLENEKPHG